MAHEPQILVHIIINICYSIIHVGVPNEFQATSMYITIVSMTHPYPFIHRPLPGLDEVLVVVIHQVFSVVVPVTTSKRVIKVFTKPLTIEPSQSWNLAPGCCCKNAKWVKYFCHTYLAISSAIGRLPKAWWRKYFSKISPTKCSVIDTWKGQPNVADFSREVDPVHLLPTEHPVFILRNYPSWHKESMTKSRNYKLLSLGGTWTQYCLNHPFNGLNGNNINECIQDIVAL